VVGFAISLSPVLPFTTWWFVLTLYKTFCRWSLAPNLAITFNKTHGERPFQPGLFPHVRMGIPKQCTKHAAKSLLPLALALSTWLFPPCCRAMLALRRACRTLIGSTMHPTRYTLKSLELCRKIKTQRFPAIHQSCSIFTLLHWAIRYWNWRYLTPWLKLRVFLPRRFAYIFADHFYLVLCFKHCSMAIWHRQSAETRRSQE